MDPILKKGLDWYLFLAFQPGWRDQAIHSANALAKEHPWMFWQLPELLQVALQREAINAPRRQG